MHVRVVYDMVLQGFVMVCLGEPMEGKMVGSEEQTLNS